MDFFAWIFIVGGLTSLAANRFGWIESGRKLPVVRLFLVPLRALEVQWIGGGLKRYLKLTGWFFLLLGVFLLGLARWQQ